MGGEEDWSEVGEGQGEREGGGGEKGKRLIKHPISQCFMGRHGMVAHVAEGGSVMVRSELVPDLD